MMRKTKIAVLAILTVVLVAAAVLLIGTKKPASPKPTAAPTYTPTVETTIIPQINSAGAAAPAELIAMTEAGGYSVDDIPGSQFIIVKCSDTYAELRCFEKNADGVWASRDASICGRTGAGGVSAEKVEGDMKTPAGLFLLGPAFGIKAAPETKMPYINVDQNSYWIDDPDSALYNTWTDGTEHRDWSSAEHLIDYSPQYNYAVVINYNTSPVIPGAGSAIFLHCGENATAGCIAVPENDMLNLLEWMDPELMPSILIY